MAILPDFVRNLIVAYLDGVLGWISAVIYADLIAHAADHFLVALQATLDFAPLEAACAGFHHASGPGTRPTHPVPQLVRVLVISYCFSWSLRQLEFQVRYNLLLKWFAGYPLFALGPDYSTLDRFEQWVIAHQHRTLFDEVLHQIDRDFPDQRHQPQIGDTFALRATAAKESLVGLLRHTARLLLHDLAAAAPESQQRVLAHVDPVTLFGPADERDDYWLAADEKRQRLATTVQAVGRCTRAVREELAAHVIAEPTRTQILTRLAHLDKIVADEVCLTTDEAGAITTVTELDKDDKGSFRLGSATDPEATYRVHGEKKSDFGYNVNVAINEQFVREINAATGAQPDASGVPTLITEQVEHQDLQPEKFTYDAAAGTGKARADFQAATGGRTQLVAPIPASSCGRHPARFTPEAFTLSDDDLTLTCPNGQTTDVAFRHGAGAGRSFRFTGCADCPLIKQCRNPKTDPTHLRQVFISDHRDILKDAKTYNQSDAGKADLKQRPRVERFIANLVRYHDARQARRRGTVNADYQAKKAGTAFNLRQWLRLRQKRAAAARLAAAEAALSQPAPPNEAPDSATLSSQLLTRSC
ncbi:MAG TPA: transposase [Anaerolineae bacterium]|nr:transposase [Anaerolineae bacterium]